MTKQPEDWLDDVPGDDIEDEGDEIIWVSKSEIKRDAEELKRLGAEIVDLGKNALRICARLLSSPSVLRWKVAAASCSSSVRCCASAMLNRSVRRWIS